MALLLLRIFWLRAKAAGTRNDNFKKLPAKDQLAVLKECLLNNPSEVNLQNLQKFCEQNTLNLNAESYRPFLKKQQELRNKPNALEEDNQLYSKEAQWLDSITPLEFNEASEALSKGDQETATIRTLEGISRLYSDEAILNSLEKLELSYAKAHSLLDSYKALIELRDSSRADEDSLAKLRNTKNAWDNDLLNYEP